KSGRWPALPSGRDTLQNQYPKEPIPMSADYRSRLERAAASLAAAGIDGLLLTPGADMTYLTGFQHGHAMRRLLALVLRADGAARWIAPTMNVAQMQDHGIDGNLIR